MLDFDLFNPTEMTGFIRELYFNEYSLQQWFPAETRQGIDYAFTRADRRREEMASYRAFDTPAPIGDRPGVTRIHGEIPPMSKKLLLTEWERLNLSRAQGVTGAAAQIEQSAYDDAMLLTESLTARLEYARGTVLTNGQVTFVTDAGFTGVVIDYGSLTATTVGTLWSDLTNGDPISDLIAATQAYIIRNKGRRPGAILMSLTDLNYVLRSAKVRTYVGVGATIPSILTIGSLNQVVTQFEIPPIATYDTLVNVPGSGDTRVLPTGKAYMLPTPGDSVRFGETTYGVTAESLELVGKGFLDVSTAPGLVGVGMTEFDPVTKWTKVAALAVPVLKDPLLITVLTIA